ncbi:hypothetical protein H2201_001223 [Coniosporium apollinis]|uniref:Ankyrin repeat protein n=2 Tax=Coniosporium TaxID=2810619 RepID=A0ABQ9P1U3_9PEZI|nr:hypothetical protein H2199_001635 [Cladosporium sp. JES 115]KAJ9668581.1 hypothetical protein H2201_001223 [Coniosporium apollinis]
MSNQQPAPTISRLLNLVPDSPEQVLSLLSAHPHLASEQDAHGYSLLHAAASYSHLPLLRALVQTYNASPNIADEDNETPLFVVESPAVAECLVAELGANLSWRNDEDQTAEEKIEAEGDWPLVAAYLRSAAGGSDASASAPAATVPSENGADGVRVPPPLPPNVRIDMSTVEESSIDEAEAPDPEFRRRIEELAARDDFQGEEGQRQLRELVTEAVTGLTADGQSRDVRRRVD